MESSMASVPVILTTRTAYPVPPERYMIPVTWQRFQLSELINKVLTLPSPLPFDFVVRGNVLRGSLQSWMESHGVAPEEVLEIEYVESLMPPRFVSSLPQDDWVSTVSLSLPGHFITGAYDATVRIFDERQALLHTITGHSAPITAVCYLAAAGVRAAGKHIIASSSQDRTVRLTEVSSGAPPRPLCTLHTSSAPVSSVSAARDGNLLVTATWDGIVGLFDRDIPTEHEVPVEEEGDIRRKRRKVVNGEDAEVWRKAPKLLMKSHTAKVSKAIFSTSSTPPSIYSSSWDFTVREWDTETGVNASTKTTPDRVHLDIAHMAGSEPILATGTADRTVSLFDLRSERTVILSLPHSSPVPSVVPHPTSPHLLTSATLSGVLQIWDLRTPKQSLVKVQREGGKCLAIDWRATEGSEGVWASGGEDKRLQVHRTGRTGEPLR